MIWGTLFLEAPIYLQNWVVLVVNVGKYISPIEHLGLKPPGPAVKNPVDEL